MASKVHLDFETYSELDVRTVGAYRYAEHPSTEILIASWAFDDMEVDHWYYGMPLDYLHRLVRAVRHGRIVGAHNAQFEQAIWNYVLRRMLAKVEKVPELPSTQLDCTAARAAMCSLPRSLERVGEVLRLPVQKDKRGADLIRLFCKPRKPTKKDTRTRVLPNTEREKFMEFVKYCDTDVETERGVDKALPPLPFFEQRAYQLDARINARGLPIDIPLVKKTALIVDELAKRVTKRVNKVTGVNPTQRDKMLKWFATHGLELENLQAKTIAALMKDSNITLTPLMKELLALRVEASKASVKKLISMARVAMEDARARGTLLYYGAHTGRWAGKLIQPQNYIRGLLTLIQQIVVFKLLETGDADLFEILYDHPLTTIAQVMRGFIRASKGNRLLIVDYSQIEARVLVWLAQETRAVEEYRQGLDRYKIMASFLWGIPVDSVTSEQRRIAKNLVLGCGFGLGWAKFIEYCAKEDIIIDNDMSKRAVNGFREYHKNVVVYWGDVERCAIAAVRHPGKTITLRNVAFKADSKFLRIKLPSGRFLYYPSPRIDEVEKFGKPGWQLSYCTEIFGRRWVHTSTYGGKLVENIVQATARDIMVEGMLKCEANGFPIVGTVHDEIISELPLDDVGNVGHMEDLVSEPPVWATGFPLAAKGFEADRYRKD